MSRSGQHTTASNLGALVIGQVAFACVLLTGAGLLAQTFRALQNVPLGFDPNHLLAVGIKLPGLKYHEPIQQATFYQQLLERVVALPEVEAAAVDSNVPFSGVRGQGDFCRHRSTGAAPRRGTDRRNAQRFARLFSNHGNPGIAGRAFGADDVLGKPWLVVIDEGLARRFFPNRDPLGQQLDFGGLDLPKTHYTIVELFHRATRGSRNRTGDSATIFCRGAKLRFAGDLACSDARRTWRAIAARAGGSSFHRSGAADLRSAHDERSRRRKPRPAAACRHPDRWILFAGVISCRPRFVWVLAYSVTQRTRESAFELRWVRLEQESSA